MNKMLLGLVLTASVAATAQTSSTTAESTVAPASQTSTATTGDILKAGIKPWSAAAYLGLATTGANIETTGLVESSNYLEIAYQLNSNYKLALRHNFAYAFEGSNNAKDNYSLIDPEIQLKTKLGTIGTSTPVALGLRYYVPVTDASRQSHTAGTLRADISTEWAMTPKVALGAYVGPRITFNNSGGTTGSGKDLADTSSADKVRLVLSPSVTYSFNDKVNMYYAPALDYATTEIADGKIGAKQGFGVDGMKHNNLTHEIGANFQIGKVGINPAIINYTDLASGETGYGKPERMEYDVNVSATF